MSDHQLVEHDEQDVSTNTPSNLADNQRVLSHVDSLPEEQPSSTIDAVPQQTSNSIIFDGSDGFKNHSCDTNAAAISVPKTVT